MEKELSIYLFGKEYSVPQGMTVLRAMEYAGYRLTEGCGCRGGFCGACAVCYRIGGENTVYTCLACRKTVEDGMRIDSFPSLRRGGRTCDIEKTEPTGQSIRRIYPEIDACVSCGACTKVCPQGIDVRQYIAYARGGEIGKCAEISFECVMCGMCATRCPAKIDQPQVAMLARRLNGRYLLPELKRLEARIKEINEGKCNELLRSLAEMPEDEIKELYNKREIEK